MAENTLKGKRIRGRRSRRPKTVERERVCADPTCDTQLSRYNSRKFCHVHAPVRFPRVRGRKPKRGKRKSS